MSSICMGVIKFIKALNTQRIRFFRQIRKSISLRVAYFLFEKRRTRFSVSEIHLAQKIGLVMVGTGIGDAIVMSGLIKILHLAGKMVFVICDYRQYQIYSELISVDKIFIVKEGRGGYKSAKSLNIHVDVVVDFRDPDHKLYERIWLLQAVKYKYAVGFNQTDLRFFDVNILRDEIKTHWSDRLLDFAKLLHVKFKNFSYDLHFSDLTKVRVNELVKNIHKNKIVIFNPTASDRYRSLSIEFIQELLTYLGRMSNVAVIVLNVKDKNLIKEFPNVIFNPFVGLGENFYLVSKCSLMITVDTSLVHVGNFFDVVMIGIYNNRLADGKYNNNILWGPNYPKAIQVFSCDHEGTETGDDLRKFQFQELEKKLRKIL